MVYILDIIFNAVGWHYKPQKLDILKLNYIFDARIGSRLTPSHIHQCAAGAFYPPS